MLGFSRVLGWLGGALRLNEAATPSSLSSVVQPTVDVFQRGFGVQFMPKLEALGIPGPSATADLILVAGYTNADSQEATVVGDISLHLTSGTLFVTVFLTHVASGNTVTIADAQLDASGLLTSHTAGSRRLLGGRGVTVPPGYHLTVRGHNLGAGQTMTARWTTRVVPLGMWAE
jgi:hypothetical protein